MIPFLSLILFLFPVTTNAQKNDAWLHHLLSTQGDSLLKNILSKPDTFQYQVIYTRINRDKHNKPHFSSFYLNVDPNRYFNPASTVKLPTVVAALEKLNKMNKPGVNKYTVMLTDSAFSGQTSVLTDTSSENDLPSVAHYIRKVFLTSDNDAYNRLYEFVGQELLNKPFWDKGYSGIRITRRFVPMSEEENRHTNPIRFVKDRRELYRQPPGYSNIRFDFNKHFLIGRAHYDRKDSLIQTPMDFTKHNLLTLEDLQLILKSVLFPESIPKSKRFLLTEDDYRFLYQYMQALPSESRQPAYDTTEFFDSYTKFFYKAGKKKIPSYIRIFNKTGWSYGFLTDAAYVADNKNGIEFMLSAVIYVNADGVLNDNKYEYETVGYPFFSEIFRVIYQHELERKKVYQPDFSRFILK